MEYGYIRVSTREQNEQRQLIAMREFGIDEKKIYMDKQSGKDFERRNYKKMVQKLKKDDTLVVKSIDRLGRNYDEILEQWRVITKEKQAAIVVLDMPLLDTRQSRDLTGTLIADIVLQLLSYVHSSAAGGGNCSGKRTGGAVRTEATASAGGICGSVSKMGKRPALS